MVNPHAGEVAVVIDGKEHVAKLTLGSLAELEHGLKEGSFMDLVARFEGGTFSPRDVLDLIFAGLRGGGWKGSRQDLVDMDIGAGPLEAAKVAGELLVRAFAGSPGET